MEDDEFGYYGDEPDVCDHDEYDADILTGRAHCYRCGEAWWMTDKELSREIELSAQMFLCDELAEDERPSDHDDSEIPF